MKLYADYLVLSSFVSCSKCTKEAKTIIINGILLYIVGFNKVSRNLKKYLMGKTGNIFFATIRAVIYK